MYIINKNNGEYSAKAVTKIFSLFLQIYENCIILVSYRYGNYLIDLG